VLQADAHVAMADVLTASSRTADALEHLRRAEAIFRAKGQTTDADACARRVQRVEDGVAG
jgi:hypothetical protein